MEPVPKNSIVQIMHIALVVVANFATTTQTELFVMARFCRLYERSES
jgi:hypothetical protein